MTNETMWERLEDNITVMLYGLPQEWNQVEKEYGPHDADRGVLGLKGKEIASYVLKEISQALEKEREEIESILPEHNGELSLEHNGHKSNYETVEEYIEWRKFDDDDFATPQTKQKCIEKDSIWVLQWYPNTPVGFNVLVGSSLSEIINAIKNKPV